MSWLALLVNDAGGSADAERIDALCASLADAGVEHRVCPIGDDPVAAAERAAADGAAVLVAGGGDGTVGAVAGVAVRRELPIGIAPLGTLNHFARDLGIPLDPAEAAAVLAAGHSRRVDVGVAGGKVFVNNASAGTYALVVHRREELQERMGKWTAMVAALRAVFPHRPESIRLEVDGEAIEMPATMVFFGNNDYMVDGGRFTRDRLDAGVVSVYALRAEHVWDLVRVGFRIARERIDKERHLEHRTGRAVVLDVARRRLLLAHDGEVTTVETPLRVEIRPAALEVLVPPPG